MNARNIITNIIYDRLREEWTKSGGDPESFGAFVDDIMKIDTLKIHYTLDAVIEYLSRQSIQ